MDIPDRVQTLAIPFSTLARMARLDITGLDFKGHLIVRGTHIEYAPANSCPCGCSDEVIVTGRSRVRTFIPALGPGDSPRVRHYFGDQVLKEYGSGQRFLEENEDVAFITHTPLRFAVREAKWFHLRVYDLGTGKLALMDYYRSNPNKFRRAWAGVGFLSTRWVPGRGWTDVLARTTPEYYLVIDKICGYFAEEADGSVIAAGYDLGGTVVFVASHGTAVIRAKHKRTGELKEFKWNIPEDVLRRAWRYAGWGGQL
jgi:hypothetical protein